jgi:hypothetical protein
MKRNANSSGEDISCEMNEQRKKTTENKKVASPTTALVDSPCRRISPPVQRRHDAQLCVRVGEAELFAKLQVRVAVQFTVLCV